MKNSTRTFGIELEIVGNLNSKFDIAAALNAAGVSCRVESYSHAVPSQWKLVNDASLRGSNAVELVSPPLAFTSENIATVRLVCETLTNMGVKVNSSCGFHVHVFAADLDAQALKNLVALFVRFEPQMDKLVPAARRATDWAASNLRNIARTNSDEATLVALSRIDATSGVNDLRNAQGGSRYMKLNLEPMLRQGTVEFRQAAGTTNADKVVGWVALAVGMVTSAKRSKLVMSKSQFSFSKLLGRVDADFRPLLVARKAELEAKERRAAARVARLNGTSVA